MYYIIYIYIYVYIRPLHKDDTHEPRRSLSERRDGARPAKRRARPAREARCKKGSLGKCCLFFLTASYPEIRLPGDRFNRRVKHLVFRGVCTLRRGDDTVGNPHRSRISQLELFELVLLLKLDKRFPVKQFEATASRSTVPSHPLECLYTLLLCHTFHVRSASSFSASSLYSASSFGFRYRRILKFWLFCCALSSTRRSRALANLSLEIDRKPKYPHVQHPEGGTIGLEALIELKFLDASFSSLSSR